MTNLFEYATEEEKSVVLQQDVEKLLEEEKFAELKEVLTKELKKYDRVYSADMTKEAKADRATLNKLKKSIDDVKKQRKKEVMKQYEGFENGCKALIKLVEEASGRIDTQVKEIEEARREERKQTIIEYYGDNESFIPLEQILDSAWLNASFTDGNWKKAIDTKLDHIKGDLAAIEAMGGEKANYVRMEYLKDLNMYRSLQAYEAFKATQEAIKEQPAEKGPQKTYDVTYTFIATEGQLISIDAHMRALGIRPVVLDKKEL